VINRSSPAPAQSIKAFHNMIPASRPTRQAPGQPAADSKESTVDEPTARPDGVDAEFDVPEVTDPRVRIEVDHAWNRPPITLNAASAPLLALAREVSAEQGRELPDTAVGGASDANFVAALGLPVLCGLGAVGDGAHAQGEFIYPDTVATQTALVAGLLGRLAEPLRG
jgi:glutamate carboxypeptidase